MYGAQSYGKRQASLSPLRKQGKCRRRQKLWTYSDIPHNKKPRKCFAVRKNRLQTIAELVEISSATCQQIPTNDLKMHGKCRHIVPCMLNEDQSVDDVKSASQTKDMAKNGFQKCFVDLYKQWQKSVVA
ncbi:hypothetical protein TNCV_3841901 [Trichonephila clavipes]|nr:hypothetical protein TNCV_3841901 [Trichonephila clavipes]